MLLKAKPMLNKLSKIISKKGRSLGFLPFFIFLVSCALVANPSRYGRVSLHNTGDMQSFTFTVSEDFMRLNKNSPMDKKNPKLSEAESELLYKLLDAKKYCLDKDGEPAFVITSRQEKVFDMTFAHLIEQNYKSRPIVPRTYFGRCRMK